MKRTLSFVLIMAVFIASLFAGCSSEATEEKPIIPIKLVPQRANLIGHVDLARILGDAEIAGLYDAMPKGDSPAPQTFQEALGLIGGDFEEGVVFGDISDAPDIGNISDMAKDRDISGVSESGGYIGIIIKGNFKTDVLIANIESVADEPLSVITYMDHEIHADSSREGAIAFLGSDGLVIGTMQVVKDVIAVQEGEQSAVKGKALNTYDDLGDGLFKLAMVVPPGAVEEGLKDSAGEMPAELSLFEDIFKDIEVVTLTVDKQGGSFPLDLRLCFTSTDSAESIKGALTFLTGMISGNMEQIPEDAQALVSLLDGLDVSLDGSCVSVGLALPMSMIQEMAQSFDPSELPFSPE